MRLEPGIFQVPRRSILHVTVILQRTSFWTLSRWSPESRIMPSAQIHTYDNVFELLNCIIKSSRLNILLKFRCKAPDKRLRNLSLSLRKETWRFWSWPRGLLEDIDWNEQRVATPGKGIMLDACYGISKESIRIPRPARIQCLMPSSHLQELVYTHLYCWTLQQSSWP